VGPPERDMLEAWTALGFLAAHTSRVKLLTLVTGVTYRDPGLLAKMATTLDVLSKGRAIVGLGAAWNEEESRGLGLFLPPTAERFERLEETLQILLQMWSDGEAPYEGRHYRPHPPILVGGGGERKTLRLVAQYAQACNLFAGPELARKLDVLREHCERLGRPYDEIEKTVMIPLDAGAKGERADELLERLRALADLGVHVAHGRVPAVSELSGLEALGEHVVPVVAAW
jgi:alkanesulfonate monooxygenase SsuD/methylene tetrahydromethanopterin reductase-like flavin-dependent oxidoreductase (luciferase family)